MIVFGPECEGQLITLPHPTGQSQFLLSRDLYQIQKHDSCSSWIVEQSIHSDGSFYIITPYNVLFLVLPFLTSDKFLELDQIVPESFEPLLKMIESKIETIADKLLECDLIFYRLNQKKAEEWILSRYELLKPVAQQAMAFQLLSDNLNAQWREWLQSQVGDTTNYFVSIKENKEPPTKKLKKAPSKKQSQMMQSFFAKKK
ncbi:Ydr279p protein family-domain-containing protein [Gorgonomyces haynaldii]|nr:Ydr279p protein family-domain-containing protein [Gorgonomyces haynaldii]